MVGQPHSFKVRWPLECQGSSEGDIRPWLPHKHQMCFLFLLLSWTCLLMMMIHPRGWTIFLTLAWMTLQILIWVTHSWSRFLHPIVFRHHHSHQRIRSGKTWSSSRTRTSPSIRGYYPQATYWLDCILFYHYPWLKTQEVTMQNICNSNQICRSGTVGLKECYRGSLWQTLLSDKRRERKR
jgi:hypothetical protein